MHDRIINQHQPGLALYPRSLSYDLLPLIGPGGWSLLRALHDHADEQALTFRGTRPIAPSSTEMQALAGSGEATLLVIKELLRVCGCLSWDEIRGKQQPRPGRQVKQAPTRTLVYYLHPLTGLAVTLGLVERVMRHAERADRIQQYLKANGLFRAQPAFLPTSVWPGLLPQIIQIPLWQQMFMRLHGPKEYARYTLAATAWVRSAADVVATLELEQEGKEREIQSIQDRVLVVMARWGVDNTVPSLRGHGSSAGSRGESADRPHIPINESTNLPIKNHQGPGTRVGPATEREDGNGAASKGGRDGKSGSQAQTGQASIVGSDNHTSHMTLAVNRRKDGGTQVLQAEAGAQWQQQLLADAGITGAQAEAAFWQHVATLLSADADGSTRTYKPTSSEQRQARRLLRKYHPEIVLAALNRTITSYSPQPGQSPMITRFGFAAGLPPFRRALDEEGRAAPPDLSAPSVAQSPPAPPSEQPDAGDDRMVDFWFEYERVTARCPTRAERCRVELLAAKVGWPALLVWLDRWERAHPEEATDLQPAYFEACAASLVNGPAPRNTASTRGVDAPAARPVAAATEDGDDQIELASHLKSLGIKKARALATLPGTSRELIDAWTRAASESRVKDRSAYIAAGIASGRFPLLVEGPAVRPLKETATVRLPGAKDHDHERPGIQPELWMACLKVLQARISSEEYEIWLAPCSILDVDDRSIVVAAPNVFVRQELEQRYARLVEEAVAQVAGRHLRPRFVIGQA